MSDVNTPRVQKNPTLYGCGGRDNPDTENNTWWIIGASNNMPIEGKLEFDAVEYKEE